MQRIMIHLRLILRQKIDVANATYHATYLLRVMVVTSISASRHHHVRRHVSPHPGSFEFCRKQDSILQDLCDWSGAGLTNRRRREPDDVDSSISEIRHLVGKLCKGGESSVECDSQLRKLLPLGAELVGV